MTVRVRNATRCIFLRQTGPYSSLHVFRTRSCRNGGATVTFPAIKNRYQTVVRLRYAVRAVGVGHKRAQRQVTLHEAAATPPSPPPPTASLTVNPQSLPYSGGAVTLTYSSSNATTCSLSATPTLWSGSNPLAVPCNGTMTLNNVPATLAAQQWTTTFTATSATGKAATATGTLTQQAKPLAQSTNWSGYVLPSSSIITAVSGTFTVPTLNCSQTPNAGEATWVGIGGNGGSTGELLQTGVTSECVNGAQTSNRAWWEEYPEVPDEYFSGMSVSPGDQIEASVYEASGGTAWVTCVDDLTTGESGVMVTGDGWGVITGGCTGSFTLQGSTSSLTYAGGYTAEWIVEDYAATYPASNSFVPFADYGTVTFTNLGASPSPWSLVNANPYEIVQNGSVLSVPAVPSGDGFSVSYTG